MPETKAWSVSPLSSRLVSLRLFLKIHPNFPPVANFSPNFRVNFSVSAEALEYHVVWVLVQACSYEQGIVPSAPRAQSTLAHVQERDEPAETSVFVPDQTVEEQE
jgi:hypothetical protein